MLEQYDDILTINDLSELLENRKYTSLSNRSLW